MRKTSLVHAKAHLSELVDAAQHRGAKILILRHGKPAAAIVPVSAVRGKRRQKRRSPDEIRAFLDRLSKLGDQESAVADLIAGRR